MQLDDKWVFHCLKDESFWYRVYTFFNRGDRIFQNDLHGIAPIYIITCITFGSIFDHKNLPKGSTSQSSNYLEIANIFMSAQVIEGEDTVFLLVLKILC